MFTWLVFGSLFWFIVTGLFVIWFLYGVNEDSLAATTWCIVLYTLFLQFLAGVDIIAYVTSNPLAILSGTLLYFMLGLLWSVFKWHLFVSHEAAHLRQLKKEFLAKKNLEVSAIPDALIEEFKRSVSFSNLCVYRPSVTQNKERITCWVAYWPMSIIWFVLDDFVKNMAEAIYDRMASTYQSVLDRNYRDLNDVFDNRKNQ